jgi:pre-mRNA-splicing factor 38B
MYNGAWPVQPIYPAYPVGYPPVVPGYLPAVVPVAPFQAYYQPPIQVDPSVLAVNKNGKEDLVPEFNTRIVPAEVISKKAQEAAAEEEEDDDTGGYLKQAKSPKLVVQGNVDSMNLPAPMVIAINSSDYFKGLYDMKSFAPVIHEIIKRVDNIDPWASNQTASCCMCLLMKLFRIKLTERQMESMLSNYDSVYVRALALMYLRLCGDFKDLYSWFEPQFEDDEEFATSRGNKGMMKLGVFAKKLLTEQKHFTVLLPRIPVLVQKSINESIKEWNKQNGIRNDDDDNYNKPRNRGHSPDPRLEELRKEKNRDANNNKGDDRDQARGKDDDRNKGRDNNNGIRDDRNDKERSDRPDRDKGRDERGRDERGRDERGRDERGRDERGGRYSYRDNNRGRDDNRGRSERGRDERGRDDRNDRDNRGGRDGDRDRDNKERDRGRDNRDKERKDDRSEKRDDRDSDRDRDSRGSRDGSEDRRKKENDNRDNRKRSPSVDEKDSNVPKKPRVDMQLLKDMYGSSSGNQSYNANPTLGATEVVRIGFSK